MRASVSVDKLYIVAKGRNVLNAILPMVLLLVGYLQRENTLGEVLMYSGLTVLLLIAWLESAVVNKIKHLAKLERKGMLSDRELQAVEWDSFPVVLLIGSQRANHWNNVSRQHVDGNVSS